MNEELDQQEIDRLYEDDLMEEYFTRNIEDKLNICCAKCNNEIPAERLEILPNTKTCVKCSDEQAVQGIMVWDRSTPVLVIVNDASEYKDYENIDERFNRLK